MDWKNLRKRADDATRPPEPGTGYVLEVTKATAGKASTTGFPMIITTLRVCEGPAAGRNVFNNFNMTLDNDFALSIFFRHMAAFGLGEEFFARVPNGALETVAEALVGRRAVAELGVRVWQNVPRANIMSLEPLPGQAPVTTVPAGRSGSANGPPSVAAPSPASAPPAVPAPTAAAPTTHGGIATEGPPPLPF